MTSLVVAGAFGGVAWYLLRRYVPGRTDVDEAVWRGDGELGFRRSLGTSVLSIIVIGPSCPPSWCGPRWPGR